MSELTTKANGAKTVTPATDTKANAKPTNAKNEVKTLKIETTAEKRIKNLEHFEKICRKHNFLRDKADDLSAYLIGRDGLKETLTIENTDGQVFEISNSHIISEILKMCQDKLIQLVEVSEKEVIEFNI